MRIILSLLVLLALAPAVRAEPKNSEWQSTTGNTVRIYNGEQPQFTIHFLTPNGQSLVAHASWIDQPNTFTYNLNDGGSAFMAHFIDGGWSIKVTGRGQTNVWKFIRWLT
ncbi:MAG: hypothetical protein AMXMBFR33_23340 [Candidatus Xenobia bacterium]